MNGPYHIYAEVTPGAEEQRGLTVHIGVSDGEFVEVMVEPDGRYTVGVYRSHHPGEWVDFEVRVGQGLLRGPDELDRLWEGES